MVPDISKIMVHPSSKVKQNVMNHSLNDTVSHPRRLSPSTYDTYGIRLQKYQVPSTIKIFKKT
jgi:hypothetical protein